MPEHLVLSHMPWARDFNTSFELAANHRPVVNCLLDLLWFEGPRLGRKTVEPLVEAFLRSISDGVGDSAHSAMRLDSAIDRRFADIQACIQKYLTASELICDRIAGHCGGSSRYVCYALRARDTTFSELLWTQRL